MEFSELLSFVPKVAISMLVVLGILITLEVKSILNARKRSHIKPLSSPDPAPVAEKVHFPDAGVQVTLQKESAPTTKKHTALFISIPVIVIGLFGLIHLISARQNTEIVQEIPAIPSPTTAQSAPRILIYRENEAGQLSVITYDDLKTLQPGTDIIIAVSNTVPLTKADFLINDALLTATGERTANGELFVRYTLQPGVTNYNIAVSVQ